MIKFEMDVKDFNKINKFGKKFNDLNNKSRPQLKYSRFTVTDNKLVINGLDGYKLFTLEFEIDNINGVDGELFIEPMNNFKASSNKVIIKELESEIRINDIYDRDIRIVKKDDEVKFFNTDEIYEEEGSEEFEISFTVKHLRDALSAYETNDIVRLKLYGTNKQIVIDNQLDSKSLVLPIRE